jgi:FAD/FMN-containing dehydrogenase
MTFQDLVRSRSARLASIILSSAAVFGGTKVYEYSSPPVTDKDCDFTFPAGMEGEKPTTLRIESPRTAIPLDLVGGYLNDASCLNKTPIYGLIRIHAADDVRKALQFARENHLHVTIAGQRHSMGGQSFSKDGLVLDMRPFNQIAIDREHAVVHVQSGATWSQVQELADQEGLSVQAMQSINVFTVGGSLSVNGHGIAHRPGPLASTVLAMRIMLGNGEIKQASPSENPDLFHLALGGYGLFGVILDADLQLVKNEVYSLETYNLDYRDFPDYYRLNISGNDQVGLFYARLSISPNSYLRETAVHVYRKADFHGRIPPLQPATHDRLDRFIINFSKTGGLGRWVRWTLEKHYGPRLHNCLSRNQAINQKEPCLVSRNEEMNDSMGYLRNRLKDTDVLQEYFIPQSQMSRFVDGLRQRVQVNQANLLNVTIRIVHRDEVTAVPYAKEDMFAFVLYFNQKLNEEQSANIEKTTRELIDLAIQLQGTYYLAYQLYYSEEQLEQAYPEITAFFAAKKRYDPEELFSSKFYEKYGRRPTLVNAN